jgi:tetratricopeptide (TPR) repeat protein
MAAGLPPAGKSPARSRKVMKRTSQTTIVLLALGLALPGCAKYRKAQNDKAAQRREAATKAAAAPTPATEASQALARGQILASQGLDQVALSEFERAIAINPRLTPAYLGIGQIQKKQGNLPKAEAAYGKAAEIEPSNFDAQYNHGLVLQLLNRVSEAVRAYLKALQIKPNDFDANLNLATAYLQLGEPGPGLTYAQRAVRLRGDSGPARVNLGAIYAALNDHDNAVIEYQQAAELMELSPELLLNLGDSLGKTGRYAEMQNTLEQLIKTKPSATAYERLASALFRQQRYDEALAMFQKALDVDRAYYPALNGVGVCLLNRYLLSEKKDVEARDQALKALRKSLQIERRQPAVVDLLTRYG